MGPTPPVDPLVSALTLSQRLGMLGARPIPEVVVQSGAFVSALERLVPASVVVDLGSGGGVPGLVIAAARPDLTIELVERRETRADHLRRLVERLGYGHVRVLTVDAAQLPTFVPEADAVVARGFGDAHTVLVAAVPILAARGLLVVSEPPQPAPTRWTATLLDEFAMTRRDHPDRRVAVLARRST